MGFLDFFKRNKVKEEQKVFGNLGVIQPPEDKEDISLQEISIWCEKKEKEMNEKKNIFLGSIKNEILELNKELDEKIIVLEKIDLNEKKETERAKELVLRNLNNYALSLKNISLRLKELIEYQGVDLMDKIDYAFSEFKERSRNSFERATLLIGKEIGEVKKVILLFIQKIKMIEMKNKGLMEEFNHFSILKKEVDEIKEIDSFRSNLDKNLVLIDSRIKSIESEIIKLSEDLENIKKSEEYRSYLKMRGEVEIMRKDLLNKINNLREFINFKELAKIFHSNEKKMKVITEYKTNFKESFLRDNGEKLIDLLDEAQLNKDKLNEKVSEIRKLIASIGDYNLDNDEADKIKMKIQELQMKKKDLEEEKGKEKNKIEKFNSKYNGLLKKIRESLKKFNTS